MTNNDEYYELLYIAVRKARPALYDRAIEIGHMAMSEFGGNDELERSARVEKAVMALVARAAKIEV